MQPALLHRLKNSPFEEALMLTNAQKKKALTDVLLNDLSLLFSSRPLLPQSIDESILTFSVLNYGVKVVNNSEDGDNKKSVHDFIIGNIAWSLNTFEKRLSEVTVEIHSLTTEKLKFKIMATFLQQPICFFVAWEISVACYSLDKIR